MLIGDVKNNPEIPSGNQELPHSLGISTSSDLLASSSLTTDRTQGVNKWRDKNPEQEIKQCGLLPLLPEVTPSQFYAELSDPKKHDPSSFCYIVHGINPAARNGLLLAALIHQGYDPKQEIDLLIEPNRIAEKKLISTSIISQNLRGTWGDVFFILDVPWGNFVSMSPRDSATNVTNPDFVLEYARPPHLLPSQLIAQTKFCGGKSAYNEVVLTGSASDQKVKIIGVGIKLTDVGDDKLQQPQDAARMREIAQMLNVPVVEFVDIVRIKDSPPEINYGYSKSVRSIYLNHNGYRYCFEAGWDSPILKDAFRGDKNTYGGHNAISRDEYQKLRPVLKSALSTKEELFFLQQIDQKLSLPHALSSLIKSCWRRFIPFLTDFGRQ